MLSIQFARKFAQRGVKGQMLRKFAFVSIEKDGEQPKGNFRPETRVRI